MAWGTVGLITNPTTGQIIADTGPLAATPFVPTFFCWSNVACNITLHHRNAANTADLHTQQMSLSTEGSSFEVFGLPTAVTLAANERLTLTLDVGFIGQIQCSIITG
jgi:hypothetical protein